MELLKRTGSFLLDLLFPIECFGCRRSGTYFCPSCVRSAQLFPEGCPFCERRSRFGATCRECRADHALDGLIVGAAVFAPVLRRAIHAFKYQSVRSLSRHLSDVAAGIVDDEPFLRQFLTAPTFTLVPIPLHRRRLRERGYNQSELLAQEYGRRFGLNVSPMLERVRDVLPQVELKRSRRLENVVGAFTPSTVAPAPERLRRSVQGSLPVRQAGAPREKSLHEAEAENPRSFTEIPKRCMLIDDLATTGATLDEAAKTLKESGARTVWGMVIARG